MRLDLADSEASPLLKFKFVGHEKPKSSQLRSRLITIAALLAFVFVVIVILFNNDIRQPVPSPDRGPVASETAPGIGFDLTPSYGTAAVRYHNGSIINIAKVPTDADYQEMMQRYSVGKSFRNPWETYCGNPWDRSPRKFWQGLKKRLGLPSIPDVARLAKVIAKLQHATEQHLGHSFPAAVIATPFFPALCDWDLDESAGLSGILRPTNGRRYVGTLYELSTAYVASGLGLCTNYTDARTCNAQEDELPRFEVLAISYTNITLFTRRIWLRSATPGGFASEERLLVDYKAGSDAIPEGTQERETYWGRVRLKILELCLDSHWDKHVDKVLLWGESANNPMFMRILEDVIRQLQDDMPEILQADPLYIAARGAAELAKRAREDRTTRG